MKSVNNIFILLAMLILWSCSARILMNHLLENGNDLIAVQCQTQSLHTMK